MELYCDETFVCEAIVTEKILKQVAELGAKSLAISPWQTPKLRWRLGVCVLRSCRPRGSQKFRKSDLFNYLVIKGHIGSKMLTSESKLVCCTRRGDWQLSFILANRSSKLFHHNLPKVLIFLKKSWYESPSGSLQLSSIPASRISDFLQPSSKGFNFFHAFPQINFDEWMQITSLPGSCPVVITGSSVLLWMSKMYIYGS